MDYVDGVSLDARWDKLSPDVHENIVLQIAAMVSELQCIHSDPPGVIGGGLSRGIWFSDYGAGPFTTREEFERWINWKLDLSRYYKRATADVPNFDCHHFVLVHGDLSPRNIILDNDNQVWLIDWGSAGLYPPIFEAASAKHQMNFPKFAQLPLLLIYNNAEELFQLESCHFGINRTPFSLPPGMISSLVDEPLKKQWSHRKL